MQMFDTLVTLLWTTRGNQELVTFTTDILSIKLYKLRSVSINDTSEIIRAYSSSFCFVFVLKFHLFNGHGRNSIECRRPIKLSSYVGGEWGGVNIDIFLFCPTNFF